MRTKVETAKGIRPLRYLHPPINYCVVSDIDVNNFSCIEVQLNLRPQLVNATIYAYTVF